MPPPDKGGPNDKLSSREIGVDVIRGPSDTKTQPGRDDHKIMSPSQQRRQLIANAHKSGRIHDTSRHQASEPRAGSSYQSDKYRNADVNNHTDIVHSTRDGQTMPSAVETMQWFDNQTEDEMYYREQHTYPDSSEE